MNLLITGALGQLGRALCNLCDSEKIGYTAYGSKDFDITNSAEVFRRICEDKPDVIVNCAAYNAVDQAESEWQQAYSVNGLGVRNLALAANSIGAAIVHFSTDYVFDGKKNRPYTLVDPSNPLSRYGESKLLGEHYVRELARNFYLIRTSWVFGHGTTNFALKVLEWSRARQEISVVSDQVSSPTFAPDLAYATLRLIEAGIYGLYHVTNNGHCSRYEWAQVILDSKKWTGRITPVSSDAFPTPARRPLFSVLDNFGYKETTGILLPDWKDATLRYLREVE